MDFCGAKFFLRRARSHSEKAGRTGAPRNHGGDQPRFTCAYLSVWSGARFDERACKLRRVASGIQDEVAAMSMNAKSLEAMDLMNDLAISKRLKSQTLRCTLKSILLSDLISTMEVTFVQNMDLKEIEIHVNELTVAHAQWIATGSCC